MATAQEQIDIAQTQVTQAREQAQAKRVELVQRRKEATQQKQRLAKAKTKLPSRVSQRALRQQMDGLAGRQKRIQVKKVETKLATQVKGVGEFEAGLTEFETGTLIPAETQITQYQAQIVKAQEELDRIIRSQEILGGIEAELQAESKEVDIILDKVNLSGIETLTASDKTKLDKAFRASSSSYGGDLNGDRVLIKSFQDYNKFLKDSKVVIEDIPAETFGVPSSQVLTQGLNISGTTKVDGLNVPIRDDGGLFGGIRDGLINISSIVVGDKKSRQKGKEVFDPKSGMFQTVSADPQLTKGTIEVLSQRLPTEIEQKKIDFLESNILTTSLPKLQRDIKSLESLDIQREKLIEKHDKLTEGKLNKLNEFIGTNKEFKEIQTIEQKISRADIKLKELKPTRTASFFGFEKEVSIKRLSTPFGFVNVETEAIGGAVGEVLSKLGKPEGIIKIEESKATIFEPQFGTQQRSLLTGEIITGEKEITIPEKKIGTPEQFRTFGEVGVGAGKFFIPVVGAGLFASEVGESLAQVDFSPTRFIKERPVEAALLGGVILTGGILKAGGLIKSKVIQKAIQKEVASLEGVPIKSLTIPDKSTGIVLVKGFREAGKIRQEVEFVGRIAKSEKGFEVVPEGVGGLTLRGRVTPKVLGKDIQERAFVLGQEFEAGAKGKQILRGSIEDVKIFEEIGLSSVTPRKDFLGITVLKEGKLTKEGLKEIEKQLVKGIESKAPSIKDIQAPIGQQNILLESGNLGLRVAPQEVGVVLKIPKKVDSGVKVIKGKGKKSSQEFLDQMFKPQVQVKEIAAPIVDLGAITEKATTGVRTAIPSGLPKEIPRAVGGAGLTTIPFEGTAMFEQTEVQEVSPVFLGAQVQPSLIDQRSVIIQKPVITTAPKLDTKIKQKAFTMQDNILNQVGVIKDRTAQIQQPGQIQQFKQAQEQKRKQEQIFDVSTRTIIQTGIKPPTPKPRARPITKTQTTAKGILGLIQREGKFKVKVRKGGKDIEIGKATTRAEAKEILLTRLKKTLRASGHVEMGGKKVQLGFLGEGFRQSKTDSRRVVEIKQQRIKRKEKSLEAKEIQFFRKQGSGRNALF